MTPTDPDRTDTPTPARAEAAEARAEEMESQRDQLGYMIASLPPEALALANHIWMTQEREVQP